MAKEAKRLITTDGGVLVATEVATTERNHLVVVPGYQASSIVPTSPVYLDLGGVTLRSLYLEGAATVELYCSINSSEVALADYSNILWSYHGEVRALGAGMTPVDERLLSSLSRQCRYVKFDPIRGSLRKIYTYAT